jgi:outer membrane protein TolC
MRAWILALLFPTSAWAAEPLSLADALAAAEQKNPSLVFARLQAAQAEGTLLSANSIFDPRLTVDADVRADQSNQLLGGLLFDQATLRTSAVSAVSGSLPSGTSYTVGTTWARVDQEAPDFLTGEPTETLRTTPSVDLAVRQELLRGFRNSFNRRTLLNARANLEVAELQVEASRQRALAEVAQAYVNWAHAVQLADIAEERTKVADEALRSGRLQEAEGRIAPVELSRLETEAVRARNNTITARQSAAQAGGALTLLIGASPTRDLVPSTPLDMPGTVQVEMARAVADAREGNLDLAVSRRLVAQAQLDRRLARHAALPTLTLDVSASFTQVINKINGEQADPLPNNGFGGGLSFAVPVGNHQARGETARAVAVEAQREGELADVAQQVRLLESALVQIDLADQEVRFAEQTLAAEEARAAAGRSLQRDLLDARTAVFDAKNRAAKARADRRLAAIELLRLQGALGLDVAGPSP